MFYSDLMYKYISILKDCSDHLVVKETPEEPLSNNHLAWMLYELMENEAMSLTKKHRWLGYVQGVMVMKGYIDVSTERKATRHIFKGA